MRRVGRPPLGEEPRQLIAIRLDVGGASLVEVARGQTPRSLSIAD